MTKKTIYSIARCRYLIVGIVSVVLLSPFLIGACRIHRNTRFEQRIGCQAAYHSPFSGAWNGTVLGCLPESFSDSWQKIGYPFLLKPRPPQLSKSDIDDLVQWSNSWEFLNLSGSEVDDQSLRQMAQFKKILMLDLGNTKISSDGIKSLSGMSELHTLILDGTIIGDECAEDIARMTSLRCLSLRGSRVSDFGLRSIAALPSLRTLDISRCPNVKLEEDYLRRFTKLECIVLDRKVESPKILDILFRMNEGMTVEIADDAGVDRDDEADREDKDGKHF